LPETALVVPESLQTVPAILFFAACEAIGIKMNCRITKRAKTFLLWGVCIPED
jgi:hypothetical protein